MADAVEDDQPPLLHPLGDLLELGRRRGDVVGAGDGQHRRGDLGEPVAHVEAGDRLADLGVALVVDHLQPVQQRRPLLGVVVEEAAAEPALGGELDDRRGAGGPDGAGALEVARERREPGTRAQQYGGPHPGGGVEQQLQPDGATDGVAGVGERTCRLAALGLSGVHDDEDAGREVGHVERSRGRVGGRPVTGQVPGHDVEPVGEVAGARRPQGRGGGAERGSEDEEGLEALVAVGGAELGAGEARCGHDRPSR